jgi:hypothetical protein
VVLVLRDVLGYNRAEVAAMLDTTETSVKASLQRARATLDAHRPAPSRDSAPLPRSPRELEVVGHFVAAPENGDIDGVVSLLADDAWLTMPPEPYEYQGHAAIAAFLRHRARCSAATCGSWPPGPTGTPRSAAICPTPRPRSCAAMD